MLIQERIAKIPSVVAIREAIRLSSILDIIMCDDYRCYEFHPEWSPGVEMGKYDSGGGDDIFVFFWDNEAVIKGFDHESSISPHAREEYAIWPGIYDGLPDDLSVLLDDKAVEREHVTFCVWTVKGKWKMGPVENPDSYDDGAYLLDMIHITAMSYCDWAADYYEVDMDLSVVESIYLGETVTKEMIEHLNPERKANQALKELAEII